jgi:hypothetical protein
MTRPWGQIEAVYRDLPSSWPGIGAMLRLVQEIRGSRYAAGLHAWTSHEVLCVVQHPRWHPDDLPCLRIAPLGDGRIELRHVDTIDPERTVEGERAFERLERFLEELRWFGGDEGPAPAD